MLKRNLQICFFLLSALCIFACSEIGIQSKKEGTPTGPISDCQKNCTGEGGLITRPIYKTWVKYDHLDLKNGFDLAVKTLQSQGH
ncbi:MAG: hypothetical protein ACXU9L_05095 [Thermodesulfobacteriota bacterium]